jgi:para-nitrobenzyl esterase
MQTVVINTPSGQLEGEQRDGLRIFRGIPYGQPLAGLGRVRRPQAAPPWEGVRPALKFGSAAPQDEVPMMGSGPKGDDCLSVNVWAPETDQPLPVMVWIHGGGFVTGSSAQPLYEASRLAQENRVVVVSFNYRLGILGFGCWDDFPELEADSNNGLRDQILALHWVRDHIAAFGGDPARITVFGESAGGMSIACLMASPAAVGLFHRAIIQSGSGDHVLRPMHARGITRIFAESAGDVAACLGGELAGIVKAQRRCGRVLVERGEHERPIPQFAMTLLPVLGDDILPRHPERAMEEGASKDIPLLIGTNTDEWNFFYFTPQMMGLERSNAELTEARLLHEFERAMPGRGEAMAKVYRYLLPEASREDLVCAFETDRMFRLPSTRILEARSRAGAQSWSYLFDWPCPLMKALKSCHVIEIPFVMGITGEPSGQFFTGGGEDAARLSVQVRAAWAAFACGEAPAAAGWPDWPVYDQDQHRYTLSIAARTKVVDDPEGERRMAWEGHI